MGYFGKIYYLIFKIEFQMDKLIELNVRKTVTKLFL